jgi:hypothetical protein
MNFHRQASTWAREEFRGVDLKDKRRLNRLVAIGATLAEVPKGKISQAFANDPAAQEGAYRFVKRNSRFEAQLSPGVGQAAFRRAQGHECVVVAVDQSSVVALAESGDYGPIGNSNAHSNGLNVMSGVPMSLSGTPFGVGAQVYWTRPDEVHAGTKYERRKRPFEDKETANWIRVSEGTLAAARLAGFEETVWFQDDRGGDFPEMLLWAIAQDGAWVTVRAAQDRTLFDAGGRCLRSEVLAHQSKHTYRFNVVGGHKRAARCALMELRFCPVVLQLPVRSGAAGVPVPLYAVHVREFGTTPAGEEPIEWLLLTTHPVTSARSARRTVKAYSLRWRIEEVHKTWKTITGVEKSQLRSAQRLALWARILFCVAVRIERLKRLSRESPDTPAAAEFDSHELMAVRLLLKDNDPYITNPNPTLAQTVDAVARLGGYTGKSSGGPPGHITISRGLERVSAAAAAVTAQGRRSRRSGKTK